MRWQSSLWWIGVWLSATGAYAQTSGANITLQLPSFSQFSVNTTVVVPDGGAAALAGDRAAAASINRFGPRGNRSIGAARSVSKVGVTARIHDPEQAERALSAAARRPSSQDALTGPLAARGRPHDGSPPSVAELAAHRAADEAAQDVKARKLFEKGRRAQASGRNSLAATYYRTSAGQASDKLRREIHAQWRTLAATPGGDRTTASDP